MSVCLHRAGPRRALYRVLHGGRPGFWRWLSLANSSATDGSVRAGSSPEYLHELDPQPQIALIVADHGTTTEQQRTRMINVDICSGSQSQRRGNLLLNLETMCFDQRTQVTATGGELLTNV